MLNPFDTPTMAAGYANSRPPVHPHVIALIRERFGARTQVDRIVDVGCGAGLSTAPLIGLGRTVIGIEPAVGMLAWSGRVAPGAHFVGGSAEAIPIADHSADLITTAGSLNWADLDLFFPEARRVLKPGGTLIIYDFGQGRETRDGARLFEWEEAFKHRYASPPCRSITPETLELAKHGFRQADYQEFEVPLSLTPDFYLDYAMTETNVAAAIASGTPSKEIREWCRETLAPVFDGQPREVLFRGFIAYIVDNGALR